MKRLSLPLLWICGCLVLATQGPLLAHAASPVQVTGADTAAALAALQSDAPLYDRAMACRTLAIAGDATAIEALAAELGSTELAAYARLALEEMPDPAATDALLTSLDRVSGSARVGILASLGRRGDNLAVPAMTRLMADDDDAVAEAAMSGLAAIATDDALQALIRQADGSTTRPSSLAAALLLAATSRGSGVNDPLANSALTHVDDLVPEAAASDAANYHLILRRADDAPARLAALLAGERPDAFRLGVQAARGAGDLGVDALLKAFPAASPQRKIALLIALSDSQAPEAFPVVLEASRSPDVETRRFAIDSLGDWSQRESVQRLLEALAENDADLAAAASAALAKLDAAAVDEAILVRLTSESAPIREAAATLAGSRRIAAAEDRLFALTLDDNPPVAQAAVRALGSVVSADRTSDLVGLLTTGKIDRTALGDALTAAGQRLSRDAIVRELAAAFPAANAAAKQTLLEVVGTLEGDIALALLTTAALSDDEASIDTATRMLGRWSGPDAADSLAVLAKQLENETFQTRAVRGLLRIVRQFDLPLQRRIELAVAAGAVAKRPEERTLVMEVLRRYPAPQGLTTVLELLGPATPDAIEAEAFPIAVAIASAGDPASVAALAELQNTVRETALEGRVGQLLGEAERQVNLAAAEQGFVPLFDGSSLSGWLGSRSVWRTEGGTIVGGSLDAVVGTGNDFLCTAATYDNFELRLQFRLRGDGANGGVNVRSVRRDDGVASGYQADLGDGYWGAIYDEARRNRLIAVPQLLPILTPEWNDYRIRCEGPRIRVWLNGTLTADFVETEDVPKRGIIALQVQAGKKVEASYRHLRLRELTAAEVEPLVADEAPAEAAFTPLFDGRSFTGWHGNLDWFRIEEESIVAGSLDKPIPRNEFLRTDKPYGNFELRLQFQLRGGDAANAGVQIRTAEIPDHHEVRGYQADMGNGWWGCLYDESRRNRVLAGPAPQDRGKMLRPNDWNDYRIRCEGDRVRLWINDILTVDYLESDPAIARTGIIAVQVHSGPPTEAWYRRIRLLELD